MKDKIFILFLLLFCTSTMAQQVTLKGRDFFVGNERFYPMVMNYCLYPVLNNGNYFISRDRSYNTTPNCTHPVACSEQIEADFNAIAGMGFNVVRTGIQPQYIHGQGLVFIFYSPVNSNTFQVPVYPSNPLDPGMAIILPLYEKILELAHHASLKVILLLKGDRTELNDTEVALRKAFIEAVALYLSNSNYRNALMAYDILNEPDYHVRPLPAKQRACEIISTWYDAIKSKDPHGLVTIGNCGTSDIFSFDPSILKVDFNSLHFFPGYVSRPYEDRTNASIQQKIRLRMANEFYQMNQASIVPWIIGETSFSASGSQYGIAEGLDGTLADQGDYVNFSLHAVCNCGGSGYSWWHYMDAYRHNINSGNFGRNFFGLLERWPAPQVEKQPAVNLFRNYTPQITAPCPVDYSSTFDENKIYYNPFGYTAPNNLKITRIVVDQDGNPIKDAAVKVTTFFGYDSVMVNGILDRVWRGDNYHTYTDINGKFIAIPCTTRYGFIGYGTIPTSTPQIRYIEVSAAGAEVKKYDLRDDFIPNQIELNKIKDDVVISGETVSSGQSKAYKGRKSLIVYNTTVNSGGNATFTSQNRIVLLPGFTANAGSNALLYIAPPDCNEIPLRNQSSSMLVNNILLGDFMDFNVVSDFKEITLSFETGFTENYISVFPNPTNSIVTIQLHSNNADVSLVSIKLIDLLGREILLQQLNEQSYSIDMSSYPKGIYFIEVTDLDTSYYQKIIKQ